MEGKFFDHTHGQLLIELEGVGTVIALASPNEGMETV